MTLLYLIRHARSRMMGDAAERWPLSDEGRREAGVLAQWDFWRKVDLIFSSPEPKALQTAEPASHRWGIPLKVADCLHELRRPRLIQDYQKAIACSFADPEKNINGIEPAAQAAERITHCLKGLVTTYPKRTLAVVSHGLVLTLFLAQLEGRWPTVTDWQAAPFAGLIVVDTNTWHPIEDWSNVSKAS